MRVALLVLVVSLVCAVPATAGRSPGTARAAATPAQAQPASGGSAGTGAATPTGYVLPVVPPARVVAAFAPPRTRYGAGHRGVDLGVPVGGQVRAAAAGTVRFAGAIAGRGVVVIAHADGITTEYEPLRVAVHAGSAIPRAAVLGTVSGRHRNCPPSACLHWAARRGSNYLDPMSLLGELGPVRLLPW